MQTLEKLSISVLVRKLTYFPPRKIAEMAFYGFSVFRLCLDLQRLGESSSNFCGKYVPEHMQLFKTYADGNKECVYVLTKS